MNFAKGQRVKLYISSINALNGVPCRIPMAAPVLKIRSSRKPQLQYPDCTAIAFNADRIEMMTSRRFPWNISITASLRSVPHHVAVGSEMPFSQTPGYALPLLDWKHDNAVTWALRRLISMKLLIHSKTSTVAPLKLRNEYIIWSHTLLWLLIHTGI